MLVDIIYDDVEVVNYYIDTFYSRLKFFIKRGIFMVKEEILKCPECNNQLKYYDSVWRIIRSKNGNSSWIKVKRYRCVCCGKIHRKIPRFIFPYKQYESEIILGVIEGLITPETLGYEDYPCEATMLRWITRKEQLLLWKNS